MTLNGMLGELSRFDEMITDHLELLGCKVLLLRLQPMPQSNALH